MGEVVGFSHDETQLLQSVLDDAIEICSAFKEHLETHVFEGGARMAEYEDVTDRQRDLTVLRRKLGR